jgi:putative transcriptional regulator
MVITRLREARQAAGLTQQQVADRLGVRRPNVARWESGTQLPRVDAALRVATAVGAPVDAIWVIAPDP